MKMTMLLTIKINLELLEILQGEVIQRIICAQFHKLLIKKNLL